MILNVTPFNITVVGAPRNIRLEGACCWGMTLEWDPSSGSRENYQVTIAREGGSETKTALHESSTNYQFRDLTPFTKYTIKLRAWYAGVPSEDWCFDVVTRK